MVEELGIRVNVESTGAQAAFKDLKNGVDNFNKSLDKNREGVQALDQLTGGAVTQVRNLNSMFKGGVKAVKSLSTSFKGLRAALVATGIGIFVVALGTAVAYWDEISDFLDGTNIKLKAQKRLYERINKELDDQQTTLKNEITLLDLAGKSTKSKRDALRQSLKEQLEINEAKIKEIQIDLKAERLQNQELTFFEKAKILSAGVLGIRAKAYALAQGLNSENDKTVKLEDELNKLLTQTQNTKKEIGQLDKQEADEKQRVIDLEEKAAQDKVKNLAEIEKAEAVTKTELRELEQKELAAHYENLIKLANKYGEDTTALEEAQRFKEQELKSKYKEEDAKALLEEQNKKIEDLALQDEFDTLTFEEQREKLRQQRESILNDELLSDEQKIQLENENAKASEEITENEYAAKRHMVLSYAQSLAQFSDILGKETAAGKTLAVASALFSTYQGAADALTDETIPNTFARIAAVGAVLSTGFAQVKGIMSTQVPGGGSTPTPVMNAGVQTGAPAFNVVGTGATSQLASAIAEQEAAPSRSYVLAQDVTTAQAMERNIIDSASLG
jgi:hypothetical protein